MYRKRLWMIVLPILLLCVTAVLATNFLWKHQTIGESPPFPPVTLHVVADCKHTSGGNFDMYNGTASYTFTNDRWPFPVTLRFPPLCYYTYGHDSQEFPFPDEANKLPEFASEHREIVLPLGKSVTLSAPFGISFKNNRPDLSVAFVFGMPKSHCEHPVVGTIYGTVEFREVKDGK